MWKALRPLIAELDPVRIESPISSGVPDVNFTGGWIELKYAKRWPVRGGPLRLPHYTAAQRAWHLRRSRARGVVWVLLKVGKSEWLLFTGGVGAVVLGIKDREDLYPFAWARWERSPTREEIVSALRSRRPHE